MYFFDLFCEFLVFSLKKHVFLIFDLKLISGYRVSTWPRIENRTLQFLLKGLGSVSLICAICLNQHSERLSENSCYRFALMWDAVQDPLTAKHENCEERKRICSVRWNGIFPLFPLLFCNMSLHEKAKSKNASFEDRTRKFIRNKPGST